MSREGRGGKAGGRGDRIARSQPGPGLFHHADRGVQYVSNEYREVLDAQKAVVNRSRKGNCWDNAVAERLFATLEIQLIEEANCHTRAEARSAIFHVIVVPR